MPSTSFLEPNTKPVRCCSDVGSTPSVGWWPVLALPRSLLHDETDGIGLVKQAGGRLWTRPWCRGYKNTPRRTKMRCASATMEAIQRMLKVLAARPGLVGQALVHIAFDGQVSVYEALHPSGDASRIDAPLV